MKLGVSLLSDENRRVEEQEEDDAQSGLDRAQRVEKLRLRSKIEADKRPAVPALKAMCLLFGRV